MSPPPSIAPHAPPESPRRLAQVGGHCMLLHDFAVDRWVSPVLAAGAPYEPFETEWLINFLRPGDTVLDIGAHIGYYTLLFARQVGPQGKVCAFEPDPGNFDLLRQNVALNGYRNVQLFHAAAAHQTGFASLYQSGDNAGDHRLWCGPENRPAVQVQTVELDRLFAGAQQPFDLIKMDIQGYEWSALRGMQQLIRRQPHVVLVCEYWPRGLRDSGGSPADYLALLRELGFSLYFIDERRRQLVRVEAEPLLKAIDSAGDDFINLLCVKPASSTAVAEIAEPTAGGAGPSRVLGPGVPMHASRWNRIWLAKPWTPRPVPGTSMIDLHGVRGFLTPGDVAFLFNLATELPPGGRYLEVGSWLGLSSIIIANGLIANLNFGAKVYCVDTWEGSPEHQELPEVRDQRLHAEFMKNVTEAQVGWFIEPIRGNSHEVASQWTGPGLDTIFIDGDHSLEGCYRDIATWRGKLNPGGRLLGHDAVPGSEVEQAVQRYCQETGCRATIHPLPQAHFIWEIHLEGST